MATAAQKVEQLKKMTRRPSTPGDLLADLLECNGLSQGEAAARLGVTRQTVNQLINGKRALTPDMAQRLGRLFGGGPELWVLMQQQVELWDALHADSKIYESITPLETEAKAA